MLKKINKKWLTIAGTSLFIITAASITAGVAISSKKTSDEKNESAELNTIYKSISEVIRKEIDDKDKPDVFWNKATTIYKSDANFEEKIQKLNMIMSEIKNTIIEEIKPKIINNINRLKNPEDNTEFSMQVRNFYTKTLDEFYKNKYLDPLKALRRITGYMNRIYEKYVTAVKENNQERILLIQSSWEKSKEKYSELQELFKQL
ncbi:hypothetical protein RNN91_00685 [Mycoplasmopsis felis]|uniref:hypothetical protein n=1 Tax=Mycoplasmopsis felis TaxID=33923 RepID=UPI002AF6BCBF|nr:hypothetical protein [Mycoplasmopsis felis]WQQ01348.1 hypothetical protein RRG54_02040 [Mycoplasmopsis felis]WQQ07528.1 hypothetical protein RRG57_02715 [Mycoplasmopsis felis]